MTALDVPADVAFARRAAYLRDADALVLADVHLGRAATSDVALPLGEGDGVRARLEDLLARFAPRAVVVAGDLLHGFGRLPDGVRDEVVALERTVADAGAELVVTPGNHDARLDDALDGSVPPEHRLPDGTLVCHGHESPTGDADRYVLGHDHPAVEIEGQRHPCFLYGRGTYRDADVLVLPAFSRLARGVAVNDLRPGDPLSPVLAADPGAYAPVVYDEGAAEPLAFPPLSTLREHL